VLVPLAAAGVLDTRLSAEWFIAVRYLLAKRRFDPAHEKLMDKYAEVLIPRSSLPKD
jgi:hypothetical protein